MNKLTSADVISVLIADRVISSMRRYVLNLAIMDDGIVVINADTISQDGDRGMSKETAVFLAEVRARGKYKGKVRSFYIGIPKVVAIWLGLEEGDIVDITIVKLPKRGVEK